jgi:threonine aldolase
MKHKMIDLRSDTVTKPTEEMRKAMYNAEVGDDVIGEDPTVIKLEKLAAEKLGKEAALFVPTGTFGNQLAIFTHCKQGDEIIVSEDSHVVQHETAAAAVIASVQLRIVKPKNNYPVWEEIDENIRKGYNVHFPDTGLIALENSLSNGSVMPLNEMKRVYVNAQKNKIPVHLDGARIFNAAEYLGKDVKEIAKFTDSVMFCLSKGLCSPVGSLLVGSSKFIFKARRLRKLMGGGMRQVGVLAAPGIISVNKMTKRLGEDHKKASRLAEIFSRYDIFDIDLKKVQTNMVFIKINSLKPEIEDRFVDLLKENHILTYPHEYRNIRFVLHNDISDADMDHIESVMPSIIKKMK